MECKKCKAETILLCSWATEDRTKLASRSRSVSGTNKMEVDDGNCIFEMVDKQNAKINDSHLGCVTDIPSVEGECNIIGG